jgi:tetrahydromethanopterin S-methyltransferase subunit G
MGLFSKKPKSIIVQQPANKPALRPLPDPLTKLDDLLPKLADPPRPTLQPPTSRTANPGTAPKLYPPPRPAKKNRKATVEPADFLALRAELIDMRARLDDSEQARAVVEARLSSLDATAAAFSAERNDIGGSGGSGDAATGDGAHDELSAKVDAIQSRMLGLQDQAPKIAEFEAQIAQLRAELETASTAAAEAAALPLPLTGPDPETLERIAAVQQRVNDIDEIRHRVGEIDHLTQRMSEIDYLTQRIGEIDYLHQRVAGVDALEQRMGELDNVQRRLASVDGLTAQLQQLNARVAAQSEMGAQLSALRDRMAQLAEQPRGVDDEMRLQLQEIGDRLRAGEALHSQVGQLAARVTANDTEARAVREHMAMLDQRLTNVSTELANQLGELGSDIDGLGQRLPEVADGSVSDEVVDALRGGQVKLANEQARYEIAFREDLAKLAEQLRLGLDEG